MNDNSINGIMMEQNSHTPMGSQSLEQWGAFTSFWSHTISSLFSTTMNATLDGATHPES